MAAMPGGLPFEIEDVVAEIADRSVAAELLAEYGRYLVRQMATLKRAALYGQAAEIHRIAHAIRGGGLTIRALGLAHAAEKLEKVTITGKSDEIGSFVSELDAAVVACLSALKNMQLGRRH